MADSESRNDQLEITINGKKCKVGPDMPFETSLNTYLRYMLHMRGTKNMCLEGGCGVCVLSLTMQNPMTKKNRTMAVNSCLLLLHSCHGKRITTIEGLGSKRSGFSDEQRILADSNGSQCGFCSPGMVMNMHSLRANGKVTMSEVENSFGGNLCRCTGYRPIIEAFRSMASDAPAELRKRCPDIEDMCNRDCCQGCIWKADEDRSLEIRGQAATWNRPKTVDEIFNIFKKMPNGPYMLVGGNTAHGVYRRTEKPQTYIDVTGVEELCMYSIDSQLNLGANMTLTDAISTLQSVSKQQSSQYGYLIELANHIDLIANVPVRNTGTIAGNLSIKYQHREFPSDLFLMFEAVGAKLDIASSQTSIQTVNMQTYLDMDMNRKLILKVKLPPLGSQYIVKTYKIMPRAQNAHAYVNAGFCFKLNKINSGQVLEKPRIVYGGINPEFTHANRTEQYLQGKQLFNENVLKAAFRTLNSELNPDHVLPEASPEYRKGLAEALFYKYILSLSPKGLRGNLASGGKMLTRPLSSAKQTYQVNREEWPINKPVIKMEAHVQTSGEAEFLDDMPTLPGELHASFVLAKEGPGTLKNIDPAAALAMKGVVAFYAADDIPGKNNFTKFDPPLYNMNYVEEIFCSGKIMHAGQPVGVIIAESQEIAREAAALVKVYVTDTKRPVITISDALESGDSSRLKVEVKPESVDESSVAGITDAILGWWSGPEEATQTIKGKFHMNTQYHFTMETQCCLCVPIEDGMDVYSPTMWMDHTNIGVAYCLGIPENRINIKVRRLGGGYGAKLSRSVHVACACAIAAQILNRPVRMVMTLEDNMEAMGKRYPGSIDYEVQCNDKGKISSLKATLYQNAGCSFNESCIPDFTVDGFRGGYETSKWAITGTSVRTDIHSNTYARGPGTYEGVVFSEAVMEHIADIKQLDPIDVRLQNLDPNEKNIPRIIEKLKKNCDFEKRKAEVKKYNKENRWKKRGISMSVMKFPIIYFGGYYSLVSVYHVDGSVAVCHGGIECGQGINTKIAQVAARFLGIDLDLVTVKPANNLTAPNSNLTGASITSETCAFATMKCCQEIMNRLEPVKKSMTNPTWKELVGKGYEQNIDMCASYMFKPDDAKEYGVEGVSVSEVEVDVLTGQMLIKRVDILENAGVSMSPELDIGQVEGAFMMGLGCVTSEEIIHDPETGRVLTNRTWNYKVPGAKDIPIEFNVELEGNAPNPAGVLRSKTTGEPAICLSISVLFAIKNALYSARKDAGYSGYFPFDTPATFEQTFLHCKTSSEQFTL